MSDATKHEAWPAELGAWDELMFEAKHAKDRGELTRAAVLEAAAMKKLRAELVGSGFDGVVLQ